MLFLMFRLRLCLLGEEVLFLPQHVKDIWVIAAAAELDHLNEVVFVSFLQCKVTFFPFPILYSLEESSYLLPTLKE